MKKIYHLAMAAVVMFAMAACDNTTTNNNNQQNQNEPVVEKPVVEEPAAPETYDHYEWTMTLPVKGWEVSNAYSDMGIDTEGVHFNVKDWKDTSIERCAPNGGCLEENRQEDIVTGDYTWTVYTKAGDYGVACYTFDPSRKMVVRVGAENIEDPKDARLLAVLNGFAVKPVE